MKSDRLFDAEALLKNYFKVDCAIASVDVLSEPERRNVILRLHLVSELSTVPPSVILKQSVRSEEEEHEMHQRFARDWAGLEFLNQQPDLEHIIPRFYGENSTCRFILQEDLGMPHISLVDSLTRPNKNEAVATLSRFMRALGRMHAASAQHLNEYRRIFTRIHPKALDEQVEYLLVYQELIQRLELSAQALGLTVSESLINEVGQIAKKVLLPGAFTVLTHGDICPDNVFVQPKSLGHDLQLIDFEWSFIRSGLLDGTYLRMSFPTCWCAKAIPEEVIQTLEQIYRQELMNTIPAANDEALYQEAYVYACAFWVLQQTLHFIPSVLHTDRVGPSGPVPSDSLWNARQNTVRPRVLARLQAFSTIASQTHLLPHLNNLVHDMLATLHLIWENVETLKYYSSFMNREHSYTESYLSCFRNASEKLIRYRFIACVICIPSSAPRK